jgi:3-hydroxybutyryl-CoA dehydrogenase
MSQPVRSILIYGYGVMGQGVARTFADAGFTTIVKSGRAADLTLPANMRAVSTLPGEAPDMAIEFVSEDVATKQAVIAEMEKAWPDGTTLIATGTSGLDLVELAHGMKHPERFIGLHYFMPADTTPVVEVMAGLDTPREAVDRAAEALRRSGKEPVLLYKPIIGFLVNRLQHAMLHEAYCLIEAGVASAADIDHAARRLLAPRMCLNGLIQQKDISGLKIHADAQRSIVPKLFHNNEPNPMLQNMVKRGETGLGAGKGFYDWEGCDAAAIKQQASAKLSKLLGYIDKELGTPEGRQPTARK